MEPEDSESQTSQIDREGEKKQVAADECEGEGGECEMEGEETDEEDGQRESDSEFDPEEKAKGRGRRRGTGGGRQLQQPTGESGLDKSAEDSDGSSSSSPQRDQQDQESFSGAAGELGSGDLASIQQKFKHSKHHMVLCPECGILYSTRLQHRKCEHKFMVRCPDCGKRCVNELGLKSHQRQHRQDLKFPCKFCLQSFRTRPDKLTHEKPTDSKYLKITDATAAQCSLRFDNILIWNRHLRAHESKKHICHTYKEFDQRQSLERHERIHSDDKPFKCHVCQRAFTQPAEVPPACPHWGEALPMPAL
ncbi:zinc finger protein 271-like [Coregonus clupeaformis]|uniref:zinc finger protein 271-like n=1 Tax=Coregonus clupeaformis TaxID=59861 RepID=UPI001E1C9B95|nr:zinc finger protein 271-like [Coregonus clupeaformis]